MTPGCGTLPCCEGDTNPTTRLSKRTINCLTDGCCRRVSVCQHRVEANSLPNRNTAPNQKTTCSGGRCTACFLLLLDCHGGCAPSRGQPIVLLKSIIPQRWEEDGVLNIGTQTLLCGWFTLWRCSFFPAKVTEMTGYSFITINKISSTFSKKKSQWIPQWQQTMRTPYLELL